VDEARSVTMGLGGKNRITGVEWGDEVPAKKKFRENWEGRKTGELQICEKKPCKKRRGNVGKTGNPARFKARIGAKVRMMRRKTRSKRES